MFALNPHYVVNRPPAEPANFRKMKRTASLNSTRSDFDERIISAANLFAVVQKDAEGHWDAIQGGEGLYPGHARRIAALAFMQMVIAWEELVEATFVRYVAGAPAPSGYRPPMRLGAAKTLSHAYQLISGNPKFDSEKHFLSFDSWATVIETASMFFDHGEPFSRLSQLHRERLHDAKKIRNRVAHFSQKVRLDFVQTAKKHLGIPDTAKLKQGYDIGQLLVDESSKGFGKVKKQPYFIHYANLFLEMADVICPASASDPAVEPVSLSASPPTT